MQDSVKLIPDFLVTSRNILESDDLLSILQKLAVAILIGLLIGMEREHSKPEGEKTFAGVRTFPLIAVLGFCAALLSSFTSPIVYVVLILSFASLVTAAYINQSKEGRYGGTSEVSILIVFLLGSLVFWNFIILAAIIGVITNLFLTLKIQFHRFVGKINEEELYATLKLAVISVIIFPLLPDSTYGPFDVLNPRMIWLMVMFVSGISFIGYVLVRLYGGNKGIAVTGLLGGLVSSTAVSLSLSRKSRDDVQASGNLAAGIILASTVMYPRIFLVTSVLNPALIYGMWIPMSILTVLGLLISWYIIKRANNKNESGKIEFKNPFELRSALIFGVVFGAVIFVSKAAQVYLGDAGIYTASVIAGITSVDAIVVSLAELSIGGLSEKIVIAAVILSTISNTIVKIIIVYSLGAIEMRKYILTGLGMITLFSFVYLGIVLLQ